jgi:hypothetical protein
MNCTVASLTLPSLTSDEGSVRTENAEGDSKRLKTSHP